MHAGLMAARHEYSFIVSCDMPFFNIELARLLLARKVGFDVVVPEIENRLEPLCAVYARSCVKPIEDCLQADIRQVYQFYVKVKTCKIAESDLRTIGEPQKMFCNLNTPEDYNSCKTEQAEEH
jgi:molybdopterin-guanine dinucleotide biosynthesis protein A